MLELKNIYMILNIINYFLGHNIRLNSSEKIISGLKKEAHKNYPNQKCEKVDAHLTRAVGWHQMNYHTFN